MFPGRVHLVLPVFFFFFQVYVGFQVSFNDSWNPFTRLLFQFGNKF